MKRLFVNGLIAAILTITSVAIFDGCKKDKVLDNTKQEQVGKPLLKFCRVDFFICPINGRTYKLDTDEAWELFERYGGVYWFYDDDGTWHGIWPQTGDPYWRPPYWWHDDLGSGNGSGSGSGNGSGSSSSPSFPYMYVGQFVQLTIVDMMNASIDERRAIVAENMTLPYYSCISLSAKIDNTLLEKVVSGEYIISTITETVTKNGNDSEIIFNYAFRFLSSEDMITTKDVMVSFVFNKITIDPIPYLDK